MIVNIPEFEEEDQRTEQEKKDDILLECLIESGYFSGEEDDGE